ncbi:hypothetical protein CN177_30975, partial [Sinorhizobium meliloti]
MLTPSPRSPRAGEPIAPHCRWLKTTGADPLHSRELTIRTMTAGAGEVAVVVEDTGGGIAEEVAGQLFKPFVST